ncbi:MAG: asparagine synthase-related protein [bacterium]|nr:asparagine synthase-related protein [bacterium]
MSGIVGVVQRVDRCVDPDLPARMLERLPWRRIDGAAAWAQGPAGLGHGRFATCPEALHEKLLLANNTGTAVLTADARIDNRNELSAALFGGSSPHREITDGELILAAWEKWGEDCAGHLLGDFAFAIWDATRRRLFCARDHSGVHPLVYYASPDLFAFASEIGALWAVPGIPRRLNETRVADFLAAFYEDKSATFYRDIYRLPPAHILTATTDNVTVRRYWALDPTRELRLPTDRDYVEHFRATFTEAVRCRTHCQAPVAAELSGGLDSSSIACVARRALREGRGRELHTITAVFPSLADDHPHLDDGRYVSQVTGLDGVIPHEVQVDNLNPLNRALGSLDEHLNIPNLFMFQEFFARAAGQGARVLLSGHDGDSTVSNGLEYLRWLARSGRWPRLWSEASALARAQGGRRRAALWFCWVHGLRPAIPDFARNAWRFTMRRPKSGVQYFRGVIRQDFARRTGLEERLAGLASEPLGGKPTIRDGHLAAITSGLHLCAMEGSNALASRAGVEHRYPFYDRRLIELCLALPLSLILRGGRTRHIFREAMTGMVPQGILDRLDKTDMSANFCYRLLAAGRPAIERFLYTEPDLIAPYVDLESVRGAWERFQSDPFRRISDSMRVYFAASLGVWLNEMDL